MTTQGEDHIETLKRIISQTTKAPTIINPNSNFVVVTYWWGRGNDNQNTARPCFYFYEMLIKSFVNYFVELMDASVTNIDDVPIESLNINDQSKKKIATLKYIFTSYRNNKEGEKYKKTMNTKVGDYLYMIKEYSDIKIGKEDGDRMAITRCYLDDLKNPRPLINQKKLSVVKEVPESFQQTIEELKKDNLDIVRKTPQNYTLKNFEDIEKTLNMIVRQAILLNETEITQLFLIKEMLRNLRNKYMNRGNRSADIKKYKTDIENLTKKKGDIMTKITNNLKAAKNYDESSGISQYNGQSIFNILNLEFKFLAPLKFQQMITKWEAECMFNNCNYLAVEYPEFARPGGYQMAINAKPLFIQKALELCPGRGVLYIDGDMFIRKYPHIFDMQDIDFMARGWWIDPRASYQLDYSITYDPYVFETSGGTMFFSQSKEAKMLIQEWITESHKPSQLSKADDRILSLIFNSYKFLLSMKIIQLPIEYLWLTLDYDERMMEHVYDYDYADMQASIFIEHPECLTSEETAAGAGAASNRTPKYYTFIHDITPVSEEMHEYLMFPTKELTKAFRPYFNYMKGATYMNDGNIELIKKGFVNPEDPSLNEQPLYIVSYDNKFGNRKYPGEQETINEISDIMFKKAANMNIESLGLITQGDVVEIQNKDNTIDNTKMLALIIRLLNDNKVVIYNPVSKTEYKVE